MRMPAPFLSGTLALVNSRFSMVTLRPEITKMPLPCALEPLALSTGRPPTPRMVMLLCRQAATSPQ